MWQCSLAKPLQHRPNSCNSLTIPHRVERIFRRIMALCTARTRHNVASGKINQTESDWISVNQLVLAKKKKKCRIDALSANRHIETSRVRVQRPWSRTCASQLVFDWGRFYPCRQKHSAPFTFHFSLHSSMTFCLYPHISSPPHYLHQFTFFFYIHTYINILLIYP